MKVRDGSGLCENWKTSSCRTSLSSSSGYKPLKRSIAKFNRICKSTSHHPHRIQHKRGETNDQVLEQLDQENDGDSEGQALKYYELACKYAPESPMIQFRRIRYLVSLDKIDVSSISPRFVLSSVKFGERKRMRETREKRQKKRNRVRERKRS